MKELYKILQSFTFTSQFFQQTISIESYFYQTSFIIFIPFHKYLQTTSFTSTLSFVLKSQD